ncbi:MAG: hypothetical protein ACOZB3_09060 [Calditrichota bacterium]
MGELSMSIGKLLRDADGSVAANVTAGQQKRRWSCCESVRSGETGRITAERKESAAQNV